jgi:hypothetical protein
MRGVFNGARVGMVQDGTVQILDSGIQLRWPSAARLTRDPSAQQFDAVAKQWLSLQLRGRLPLRRHAETGLAAGRAIAVRRRSSARHAESSNRKANGYQARLREVIGGARRWFMVI